MDFARKQLEKYGWKEGRGLGKNEDGISEPVKAKRKSDNAGIGHDGAEDFTNRWWENVYNQAADNIAIQTTDGSISVKVIDPEAVEIATKPSIAKIKKANKRLKYGSFTKKATLTATGLVPEAATMSSSTETPDQPICDKNVMVTDDDLLKACGGRTADKGARHGVGSSGKLKRIAEQDELVMKMQHVQMTEPIRPINRKLQKKLKRLKTKMGKHKSQTITLHDVLRLDPDLAGPKHIIDMHYFVEEVNELTLLYNSLPKAKCPKCMHACCRCNTNVFAKRVKPKCKQCVAKSKKRKLAVSEPIELNAESEAPEDVNQPQSIEKRKIKKKIDTITTSMDKIKVTEN